MVVSLSHVATVSTHKRQISQFVQLTYIALVVGSLLIGAKLISSVDGAALVASADLIDTGVEPLDLVGAVGGTGAADDSGVVVCGDPDGVVGGALDGVLGSDDGAEVENVDTVHLTEQLESSQTGLLLEVSGHGAGGGGGSDQGLGAGDLGELLGGLDGLVLQESRGRGESSNLLGSSNSACGKQRSSQGEHLG